jgi:hypothetical protein
MTHNSNHQIFASTKPSKMAMKKIALLAVTALVLGSASAHAEDQHVTKKHQHLMSSHARLQERDAEMSRRGAPPNLVAPQTGSDGANSTGRMDDPTAEGRTSGG